MFDPQKHRRRSIRLPENDYLDGAYFVTICTRERACIFGDMVDDAVRLSEWGTIVQACWLAIPNYFASAELDAFVIMPNHLHGILFLHGDVRAQLRPYSTTCFPAL